jgi:hypothetical protein
MSLIAYRPWFYAAALYNLVWGVVNILFPNLLFQILGLTPPAPLPIWQVVGMFVLVYAPAYWWAGRYPERYPHFIAIGLLGKICGPVGFVWAAFTGQLPLAFGLTLLTNDLFWWPAFALYLQASAQQRGGWRPFLRGE